MPRYDFMAIVDGGIVPLPSVPGGPLSGGDAAALDSDGSSSSSAATVTANAVAAAAAATAAATCGFICQVSLPDSGASGGASGAGLLGPLISVPAPSQKAAKVGAAARMLAALKAAMVLN